MNIKKATSLDSFAKGTQYIHENRFNLLVSLFQMLLDFFTILGCFLLVEIITKGKFSFREHLFLTVGAIFLFGCSRLYESCRSFHFVFEITYLLKASFTFLVGMAFLSYTFQFPISRDWLFLSTVTLFILCSVERALLVCLVRLVKRTEWVRKRLGIKKVIIYKEKKEDAKLDRRIEERPMLGLEIMEESGDDIFLNSARFSKMDKKKLSMVFVRKDNLSYGEREKLRILSEENVKVIYLPKIEDFFPEVQEYSFFPIPLPMKNFSKGGILHRISQKIFDLLGAILFIIGTFPVWIPVILIYKLAFLLGYDSSARCFFSQLRVGKDGKLFRLYKFRTMYESEVKYGSSPEDSKDPRVTPLGRFLRRTSIDEFPQVFNVFLGHMSPVGPRPEQKPIADKYSNFEKRRLTVKPGMTGLWQISKERGDEIHENIEYDLYYIQHKSIFLDLAIMVLTPVYMVIGKGSY